MSYNTRTGLRSNQRYSGTPNSYNQQNTGGYSTPQSQQQQSYTQPAYSTPTGYTAPPATAKQTYQPTTPTTGGGKGIGGSAVSPAQPPLPPAAAPSAVVGVVKDSAASASPAPAAAQPKVEQVEGVAGAGGESMDTSEDGSGAAGTGKGPKFRPPWNKRGPSGKVNRKLKKRRQNARLRNLLSPKNAMMVLHELHPELKMVVSEQTNAANQVAYTVEIEVEGKIHRGHGMSKVAAKHAASENALKAVLLGKLEKNNLKINPDNTISSSGAEAGSTDVQMKEEGGGTATAGTGGAAAAAGATGGGQTAEDGGAAAAGGGGSEAEDSGSQQSGTGRKRLIEDDVPWGSLASFALFKLFAEWQSQGYQIPPSGLPPVFQKSSSIKKIPDDANQKHPVQLLNQIRPGSQYSESREGQPPHLTFKFTVQVDGQTFQGVGTNKKDAKKDCAKHALEALGVKYE